MSNSLRDTRTGRRAFAWASLGLALLGMSLACSANKPSGSSPRGSGADGGTGNIITGAAGINVGTNGGGLGVANGGAGSGQPATCTDAIANATYVGCDFWPTVVYNPVYSVFDFAAVVANAGTTPANITVVRGSGMATATVQPGSLARITLPWVKELKGDDFDATTQNARPTKSVRVDGGAYHLTSDVPVTVWQFNPVEYKKPASVCPYPPTAANSDGVNCESVSADAALLIPSSALTGNYRVTSKSATPIGDPKMGMGSSDAAGGFTITGTQNTTHVKVQLTDALAVGTGIAGGKLGDIVEFDINAGDVLELLSQPAPFATMPHSDISGSIVNANKPVQVIGFNPLTSVPSPPVVGSCCADHLEETVLPAEVLGKDYLVASPSTHKGTNAGHYVRFFGDFDGTTLRYRGTPPAGAPTTLSAGQVVEVDSTAGFEVVGNMPFALTSIMKSATVQNGCATSSSDPDCFIGDSSMSDEVAVEQYRTDYIFLAPDDFAFNWADVMIPTGAAVKLDGTPLAGTPEVVTPAWSVIRVPLMGGANMGAHKLVSDKPVGLQVMGYGHATSYYYPGGLNLTVIAEPPVVR